MPATPKVSPYKRHVLKWQNCTACHLCESRKKVVLYRGDLPCDMLFIGEAPGPSEDVIGQPFIGPAGRLLDGIIVEAVRGVPIRKGFTNLVCCIPKSEEGPGFVDPDKKSIMACRDRLMEMYELAKPQLVVAVGNLSAKYLDQVIAHRDVESTKIVHPAAILRADKTVQGIMFQGAVATLRDALYETKKRMTK